MEKLLSIGHGAGGAPRDNSKPHTKPTSFISMETMVWIINQRLRQVRGVSYCRTFWRC